VSGLTVLLSAALYDTDAQNKAAIVETSPNQRLLDAGAFLARFESI
jgi:hypothetical protein